VAEHIHQHYKDKIENLLIVLPNKRGALFLKNHLSEVYQKAIWLPKIISAEELIENLSGLQVLEEIDLTCYLYESYKTAYGEGAETFDSFIKWGQMVLQDFNELDRYLADSEQLYENLKDIKIIENWSLNAEDLTQFQSNYLRFMSVIGNIYKHFTQFLINNKWAYQGLAYRHSVQNLGINDFVNSHYKTIFCGFNALNAAELKIFKHYTNSGKAEILWDADKYYFEDEGQEAGLFLRKNLQYFSQKDFSFIEDNFKEEKCIEIISVPKQMGQAQVIKQSVQKLINARVPLDKVAIVLANEKMLWPVLQQLPADVGHVNITMEYPLRYTSTFTILQSIIAVQATLWSQPRAIKTIYYKDFLALLRQPLFAALLKQDNSDVSIAGIIKDINSKNIAFVAPSFLNNVFYNTSTTIKNIFYFNPSILQLSNNLSRIIEELISYFSEGEKTNASRLELEYLYILSRQFNRIKTVIEKYPHFNDILSFKQLFNQIVGNTSAPFVGEPLKGLQIMGVLETRTIDFEYLIFVNVNEGVLPSGKTVNSFIPNDLKQAFGMPLYIEKDAIYAYHFYRLLQRAKQAIITYDSVNDSFGKGEKSRFVTQLLLELPQYNANAIIHETVASAANFGSGNKNIISFPKDGNFTSNIIAKLKGGEHFEGLSPSALIMFKQCSLKFYFRYQTKLKETEENEESAESNTLGSILHLCLQNLYSPYLKKIIFEQDIKNLSQKIEGESLIAFSNYFGDTELKGKLLLQNEVVKTYAGKQVQNDLKLIQNLGKENKNLTIIALEQSFSSTLELDIFGQNSTIYLQGKIDRLDKIDAVYRVIDYKMTIHKEDKFEFTHFEQLFNDKNYNKQLQLFIYAWLAYKNNICAPENIVPCMIGFKKYQQQPYFVLDANKKQLIFTKLLFGDFEDYLKSEVETICNQLEPFSQTTDLDVCEYCSYNAICNRAN
jgi:ATP-dependent helicase/nuclease subunit B